MSSDYMFPVDMYSCPLSILWNILRMSEFGFWREISIDCKY